jgi:hypothetical protein
MINYESAAVSKFAEQHVITAINNWHIYNHFTDKTRWYIYKDYQQLCRKNVKLMEQVVMSII